MGVTARNLRDFQNAFVLVDDQRPHRIVDAFGPDVVKSIDDFINFPVDDTTGDPVEWTTTVVEVGAGNTTFSLATDAGNGVARITTAANENDGGNYQMNGLPWSLHAGNLLYMRARVQSNDATQSDFFIGLSVTDTAILGGVTDRIGWECLDGSTTINAMIEKNSTETTADMGTAFADDTYIDLELMFDGPNDRISLYTNGVEATTFTTFANIPDDVLMRKSVEFLTGEAVANTFDIDIFTVIQFGRNLAA